MPQAFVVTSAATHELTQAVEPSVQAPAGPAGGMARDHSPLEAQLAVWIDAIVDRNEAAFAALYDATFSRVNGLALRIVRRHDLAEEVVEDTFFQVWRQAVRFDPTRGSAQAWLLGMAHSRAIDVLRRESRHQHDELHEEWEQDAQGASGFGGAADELLELARNHADLHRALSMLDSQPRQLVSLAFFRGYTHEEIAAHSQLPLGTVKSQIRRSLMTLRETLCAMGMGHLNGASAATRGHKA
jgi:RNA polymerase sigma factor (sigma-70 family)